MVYRSDVIGELPSTQRPTSEDLLSHEHRVGPRSLVLNPFGSVGLHILPYTDYRERLVGLKELWPQSLIGFDAAELTL